MTVLVSSLNVRGVGGGSVITQFSDSFNRASGGDTGSSLGPNWAGGVVLRTPLVNPPSLPTWGIAAGFGGINVLSIGSSTGTYNPNTQFFGFLHPMVYTQGLVSGKTQFAQCTINKMSSSGGSIGAGVGVFVDSAGNSGYIIQIVNDTHNFFFQAVRGVSAPVTFASGASTVVDGDTIRIEVTAGSPNSIRWFKNGTLQNSTTDSNLAHGVPGFFCDVNGQTGSEQCEWKNWSGGIGP